MNFGRCCLGQPTSKQHDQTCRRCDTICALKSKYGKQYTFVDCIAKLKAPKGITTGGKMVKDIWLESLATHKCKQ